MGKVEDILDFGEPHKTYLDIVMELIKEDKPMEIKANRKPVNKKSKVSEILKQVARDGIACNTEIYGSWVKAIDDIYTQEQQGEVESVDIPRAKVGAIFPDEVRIPIETVKQMAKAAGLI